MSSHHHWDEMKDKTRHDQTAGEINTGLKSLVMQVIPISWNLEGHVAVHQEKTSPSSAMKTPLVAKQTHVGKEPRRERAPSLWRSFQSSQQKLRRTSLPPLSYLPAKNPHCTPLQAGAPSPLLNLWLEKWELCRL